MFNIPQPSPMQQQTLHLLILLLLLLSFPFIHMQHMHMQFHDVTLHQLTTPSPPSSSSSPPPHSLPLLPRHHLHPTTTNHSHSQYSLNSLLLRDQLRVSSLTHLLSPHSSYHLSDFSSSITSGLNLGSGEYFIRIGVGSPPRPQYLILDSGSDVLWLQCLPCSQCYSQSDPIYNPSFSSSFSSIPCSSSLCSLLTPNSGCTHSGHCLYQLSYSDGSFTKGTLAFETLTFGSTTINNVAIGCGHRNSGLFTGASGLLGLGSGPMSFISQLGGQLGGAFSYCLLSRGADSSSTGSLIFGRSSAVPVGAVWVPLLRNPRFPSFYYIALAGLAVGGQPLPLTEDLFRLTEDGDNGVVIDTGTAVTRLPAAAYEVLRDAFVASTAGLPRAEGVSIFDTCYNLFGFESVRVPTVALLFAGGTTLTLPARNFLIPVDDGGRFCFAFAASSNGLSIIGNIQQEGIQISFDTSNGFVGFGPNTC
ncbi:Aspartic peptidase A1 family protein [Dioscorea alata]|uniref:Aspartic peptidase A1 family protein n=1 Tax=Dioscorea alata TaxID=55571 RepID=A0ACB7V6Y8_DIOAL|nr:Aspartic peptidase A1 family protein [Dioscorea alata]